jgi:hypothetical protein
MENMMQLGLVGAGNLGTPICRHLIEAGHTVMAYDVSETHLSRITNLGAQAADRPKAMAQVGEVVCSSLPGPREVEQVALGQTALSRQPSPRDRRPYRLASADVPREQNEEEIRGLRSTADAASRSIIALHLLELN